MHHTAGTGQNLLEAATILDQHAAERNTLHPLV